MPELSIVIPTYNSQDLIRQCLDSLALQHSDDFEVIVVNDGSTDQTQLILHEYQEQTALHLTVLTIQNMGPAGARNRGVEIAKAPWIGFLDADVIADEEWVSTALTLLQSQPEAGAFEGRTEYSDFDKITPFTHQSFNPDGGRYLTCNLLIQKSLCCFYSGYRIPYREDTDLAFTLLSQGYDIIFHENLLVYHPPLSPSYARPIQAAKRYYYDGLLERRFPERYRNDVDAHVILGVKVPHLRRRIYQGFALSQIACIFSIPSSLFPWILILHLISYFAVFLLHVVHTNMSRVSFKDFMILLPTTVIVPWVMLVQLWRGRWAFRKEGEFQVPGSEFRVGRSAL